MADPRPPLWQVMQDAYYSVTQHPDVLSEECERLTIAAELRAIAEEIDARYKATPIMVRVGAEDIAKMLRAEADRAEAGE